jgi:hypothetical protein
MGVECHRYRNPWHLGPYEHAVAKAASSEHLDTGENTPRIPRDYSKFQKPRRRRGGKGYGVAII